MEGQNWYRHRERLALNDLQNQSPELNQLILELTRVRLNAPRFRQIPSGAGVGRLPLSGCRGIFSVYAGWGIGASGSRSSLRSVSSRTTWLLLRPSIFAT